MSASSKELERLAAEVQAAVETQNRDLPVDSLREAIAHLRRPFTISAVRFKVQAEWPKGDPKTALIAPYIDSRLVSDRLNTVAPDLWEDEYEPIGGGKALRCKLTIDGVTRQDAGEGRKDKDLHSDAFKRAAVKFGVGAFLYAMPKIIIYTGGDKLEVKVKKQRGKPESKVCLLTTAGENYCRSFYASWLEREGTERFGDPLDHGDAFGAAGDLEVDAPAPDDAPESGAEVPREAEPLTDEDSLALKAEAEALWKSLTAPARKELGFPTKASFKKQLEGAMRNRKTLDTLVGTLREFVKEATGNA